MSSTRLETPNFSKIRFTTTTTLRPLGSPFGPQFDCHLSDLRISHKPIPSRLPEVNGTVERSHKTDSEEFYQGGIITIRGVWLEN
jgi:hypothetical protein